MKLVRFHSVFASLLIVVLAAAVAQASTPALTFTPAKQAGYDTSGVGGDQVILADLNGDGIPDMVVCNTDSYSVFLGNGDGTFSFNNNYPSAGTGANLMVVADLNGDGILDIAATTNYNANATGGGVDVLLGVGDGTFTGPVSVNAGPIETLGIAVGDVDNDGHPDLVVTSNCQPETCLNGNVTLLLNKGLGDGTFHLPIIITSSTGGPVALADMNHDGNLDIVFNGGVLLGDGAGDFTPVSGGELLGGAVSIAIKDLNGDGILDVVEATDEDVIDVLLGNGDGTLQQAGAYKSKVVGAWPLGVTVADINGDGLPDIVVADECQFQLKQGNGSKGTCNTIGQVSILTNKGGVGPAFAGFNVAQTFASGGYQASSVAVVDIDGDGKPDLVVSNLCQTFPSPNSPCSTDGWVAVLLNTTLFTTTTHLVAAPSTSSVNQTVILTSTTTSSGSVIANGDTVTFYDGANVIGTAPTTNGVATLSTAFAYFGSRTLKATYGGDLWNASSSGTASEVVSKIAPAVSFTGAPASALDETSFTVTATSNETGPYAVVPTISASPGNVCALGAVTNSGPGSYQATVTVIKASGTCSMKAVWAASPAYFAATATQSTTAY
jgi:hypothetical protein